EVCEVGIVQRICLAEIATWVQLIEPNLARCRALGEEQHNRLNARTLESAAGAIEDRVQFARFEKELAERDARIIRVREKCVLDDNASASPCAELTNEVLKKEKRRLRCLDGEVLLNLGALTTAERRVREDNVVAVFLLDVVVVQLKRVCVNDVWSLDAVEDHVHQSDHVGEGLLFLAVKGAGLELFAVGDVLRLFIEPLEGFAKKASGA